MKTKQTPLHLAAEAGQLTVCETLLSMKADAVAIDNVSTIEMIQTCSLQIYLL